MTTIRHSNYTTAYGTTSSKTGLTSRSLTQPVSPYGFKLKYQDGKPYINITNSSSITLNPIVIPYNEDSSTHKLSLSSSVLSSYVNNIYQLDLSDGPQRAVTCSCKFYLYLPCAFQSICLNTTVDNDCWTSRPDGFLHTISSQKFSINWTPLTFTPTSSVLANCQGFPAYLADLYQPVSEGATFGGFPGLVILDACALQRFGITEGAHGVDHSSSKACFTTDRQIKYPGDLDGLIEIGGPYNSFEEAQVAAFDYLRNTAEVYEVEGVSVWQLDQTVINDMCDWEFSSSGAVDDSSSTDPEPQCSVCRQPASIPSSEFDAPYIDSANAAALGWASGTSDCATEGCTTKMYSISLSGSSYWICSETTPTMPYVLFDLNYSITKSDGTVCTYSGTGLRAGTRTAVSVTSTKDGDTKTCNDVYVAVPPYILKPTIESCTTPCVCSDCLLYSIPDSAWKCNTNDKYELNYIKKCTENTGLDGTKRVYQCIYRTTQEYDPGQTASVVVQRQIYGGLNQMDDCGTLTGVTVPSTTCAPCDDCASNFLTIDANDLWTPVVEGIILSGEIHWNDLRCRAVSCNETIVAQQIPFTNLYRWACIPKQEHYEVRGAIINKESAGYVLGKLYTYRYNTPYPALVGANADVTCTIYADGVPAKVCGTFEATVPSFTLEYKNCWKKCIRKYDAHYNCTDSSWSDVVTDGVECGNEESYSTNVWLDDSADPCTKKYWKAGDYGCIDFVDLDISCAINYPAKPTGNPQGGCCPGYYVHSIIYFYKSTTCSSTKHTVSQAFYESYVADPASFFACEVQGTSGSSRRVMLDGPYSTLSDLRAAHTYCAFANITLHRTFYSDSGCSNFVSSQAVELGLSNCYVDLLPRLTSFGCDFFDGTTYSTWYITYNFCYD